MKTWITLLAIVALAAVIVAVVGLVTSDMLPEGAVAGAVVGVIVGSWLAMRIYTHRSAMQIARQDPQDAARQKLLQDKHDKNKLRLRHSKGREFDDITVFFD